MIAIHAAVAQQARERVIDAFRVRGATALDRAVPWAELEVADSGSALEELIASGVIRPVDGRGRLVVPGDSFGRAERYYLDEATVIANRKRTRKPELVILAVLVGLLVAALIVALIRRGTFAA